jgi:hypothetical protein
MTKPIVNLNLQLQRQARAFFNAEETIFVFKNALGYPWRCNDRM